MKQTIQNGFWFAKTSTFNRLAMTLFFVASVTACNKEEFYQKDYLENPFSDNTVVTGGSNGGDSSGVGSTQGGVDSGVTSGSTNGTTGSSTSGSNTSGSTDGSTSGGTTGGTATTGSTAGGSTTGSATTGSATTGSTVGGSTTGGTTGGSATTGSTAGGSTTGSATTGSTAGGSSTGSSTGGVTGVDAEEKFMQNAQQTKKVDIMWVIDNSGSMADEQKALGDNFDKFITQFIHEGADFKMGITTTDTSSSAKKGKMVTGSDTKLTSAAAAANPTQFMSDFKSLVKQGTAGSGNEMGLMATEGFMEKYAASFIRPDAYLAVVILSDEEDQSPKTVKAYTDYLKSFKANAGLVKIYSIVNVENLATGGNTIGHARYEEASKQTAGVMSSINADFADVLLDMGSAIVNLLDSFALAAAPIDGTLKVFVNGVETTNYSYDSASHSIKFDAAHLPPVGAQVTVKYKKVQ